MTNGIHRIDTSNLNLDLGQWTEDWLSCVFQIIWSAYDGVTEHYQKKGVKAQSQSEDEITTVLLRFTKIVRGYSPVDFEPLDFVNQPPDKSVARTRKSNTNDIGVFFGNEIEKPAFIFESKKISSRSPSGVKSYLEDLTAYLDDYYGAHLEESGLIAYLHIPTEKQFFDFIERSIGTKLAPSSSSREQRKSNHRKTNGKKGFVCHHLAFAM